MKQYFQNKLCEFFNIPGNEKTNIQIKQYPKFLYKYRDCNSEYSFDIIENQYLWATKAQNFEDPTDSLAHFDFQSEVFDIENWILNNILKFTYYLYKRASVLKEENSETLEKFIEKYSYIIDKECLSNPLKLKGTFLSELEKLTKEEQEKVINYFRMDNFEKLVEDTVLEIINNSNNILRNNLFVCSLTKRRDNQKMWEEYACKYSGFVIEYDLSKYNNLNNSIEVLSGLFPVEYCKEFPKVSWLPFLKEDFYRTLYKKEININSNKFELLKQLFLKRIEYQGEEEWRIIYKENKILFPFVSGIYMGYKINIDNKEKLTQICKKHSLPLFKQCQNPITNELYFEQIL